MSTTLEAPARQRGRTPARTDEAIRQPARDVILDRDGNPIARSRKGDVDKFDIPAELKDDGWSYEYKRISVYNQPDASYEQHLHDNGWRRVPKDRPGFAGRTEIDGLGLFERPQVLTDEARAEDKRKADSQIMAQHEQYYGKIPQQFAPLAPKFTRGTPEQVAPRALQLEIE